MDRHEHEREPWPSPIALCLRFGWPVFGIILCFPLGAMVGPPIGFFCLFLIGLLLLAFPVNAFLVLRGLDNKCVSPETKERSGYRLFLALFYLGCLLMFLVFFYPAIILGSCLITGVQL